MTGKFISFSPEVTGSVMVQISSKRKSFFLIHAQELETWFWGPGAAGVSRNRACWSRIEALVSQRRDELLSSLSLPGQGLGRVECLST